MFLCAFAMIKPSVKLFSLPREILLPIIALLCVLGAFAQKLSMFDIYLMFGFGILGLCMRKVDIPIGPMVLGVILGNMLDQNFRRAMYIFEDKSLWQILIERPLGTFLIAVVLITFINGIWPRKNKLTA
jgi:putative tricarboxylic transport membrane protein